MGARVHCASMISLFNCLSPVAYSSPSALKLKCIANHAIKLMLDGLEVSSNNPSEHLCKPNLSTMVLASDTIQSTQPSDSS